MQVYQNAELDGAEPRGGPSTGRGRPTRGAQAASADETRYKVS
jgi:hypothetical protein